MKVLVVGATGAVGSAAAQALAARGHEVVRVGRTRGDLQVDITSDASVEALYAAVGRVDAIVSAAGGLFFGPLVEMTPANFNVGLQDKLLGQVRLALLETNGVTWLLPRAVGHARACDWLLTGRRVPAAELAAAGFVSRVLQPAELMPAALEMAREVAASAPRSIRLVKRMLHKGWTGDLHASLLAEIDGVVATSQSPDLLEGMRAFQEKRVPRYSGE